jgi:hypothetical protein
MKTNKQAIQWGQTPQPKPAKPELIVGVADRGVQDFFWTSPDKFTNPEDAKTIPQRGKTSAQNVVFCFKNGFTASIATGIGTYSSGYGGSFRGEAQEQTPTGGWSSRTAEVMVSKNGKALTLDNHDACMGWMNLEDIAELLFLLSKGKLAEAKALVSR